MKYVAALRPNHPPLPEAGHVMLSDQAFVAWGRRFPGRDPTLEMRQLDAENGCLQCVEARVPAEVFVIVLRLHAVNAEASHPRRPAGVAGHADAGVAVGAQVLTR